jgi:hypothetical protein
LPTTRSGRSTRKRIRERVKRANQRLPFGRPFLLGAAVPLFAAVFAAGAIACDDGDDQPAPTTTATAAQAATPAPTPTPHPDLAALIGDRADLPDADPVDLARRYGRIGRGEPATIAPKPPPAAGDAREFTVARLTPGAIRHTAPPEIRTTSATLRAVSEHAYFFAEAGLGDDAAYARAAELFESRAWPEVTAVFGQPAIPGIDGDPRVVVLHADLGGIGGYHAEDDLFARTVLALSNEAEMVYLDSSLRAGGEAFNVVLAHELQHLVHSNNDGGEESWVNEGLSETASALVGGAVSSVASFESNPETQLNAWSLEGGLQHYGASASFLRYVSDRLGGEARLGEIARERRDGIAGIDAFLSATQASRFSAVFADWIAANILNEPSGRFGSPWRTHRMSIDFTLEPGVPQERDAAQFGTHYYEVPVLSGEHVLRFSGRPDAPVLPTTNDRAPMLWGNAGDGIDTMLTREVDLTGVGEPILTFRTWFDIEPWYDWGYVAISTDDGATWQALAGRHTRDDDAVRRAYGPGYGGRSGGGAEAAWLEEGINLTDYTGGTVLIRFEYVTDGATHGEGWAIDDVRIEGTGVDDRDVISDGWRSDGWVRIDGALPQTYVVRLIARDASGGPVVLDVPLDARGNGELRFDPGALSDIIIAIAGTAEGTNQPAPYRIELVPA